LNQNLKTFFFFSQRRPKSFRPSHPCGPSHFFLFSLRAGPSGIRPTRPLRPMAHRRPSSSSTLSEPTASQLSTAAAGSPPPCSTPSPSRGKMNRRRCPFHLPDSMFPLPIFSPTRNGFAIEAPPSRRQLLLDRPPPVVPRPIKATLEHYLHTTFPALASARSIRTCIALPPSSTDRRLCSSTLGHHSHRTAPICLR
jgi:hypothetical protein